MVTMTDAAATRLVNQHASTGEDTMRRLIAGLSRSLAGEGISDALYDTLNGVLDGYAPADEGDAERIADLFRRSARQLVHMVPHLTLMYPTEEIRRLRTFRDSSVPADRLVPHLRRFALSISALLDLMGDDA
ncbi:DUF6415 family natural product biosynthesis protein [Streptomyces sp. CA-251251]|uniref:DUF6415 family natural product biosynthesis protein n=1 Tax=Streptomyces sp. CA-251251 TaxID=3240063 RepID=UPI003D91793D